MRNNFRKVCALVLAIVMCIGTILPVFASEGGETATCPGALNPNAHTKENCEYVEYHKQEPTCGVNGYTVYKCTICTALFVADHLPAIDGCEFTVINDNHLGDGWYTTKAPTCGVEGEKTRICKVHNKTFTEKLDALTHKWENQDADCSDEYFTQKCAHCGEVKAEAEKNPTVGKHTLEFEGWYYIDTGAKADVVYCTDKGNVEAHFVCKVCGDTVVVENVELNGTHANMEDVWHPENKAPTCFEAGVQYKRCTVCGFEEATAVDPTGAHIFEKEVEGKDATCAAPGLVGGMMCTTPGCTAGELIVSGEHIGKHAGDVLPQLAHKLPDGTPIVYPEDCTEFATQTGICVNCETEQTIIIEDSRFGHDGHKEAVWEKAPTCTDKGLKAIICECEGCLWVKGEIETVPANGHDWNESVIAAGDCTTAKVVSRTCKVCGVTETVTTPAPGHQMEDTVTEANCVSPAMVSSACKNCSYKVDIAPVPGSAINPDNHAELHKDVITTTGTCLTKEKTWSYCSACDWHSGEPVEGEYGPHAYPETPNSTTAATCTADATATYICTVCGHNDVRTEADTALGHDHKYAYVAPVCTIRGQGEDGYHKVTCTRCNFAKDCGDMDSCAKADEHVAFDRENYQHHSAPVKGETYIAGTCDKSDHIQYECSDCGLDFKYEIPNTTKEHLEPAVKTEENYKAPTCTEAGWFICVRVNSEGHTCGTKVAIPALGHKNVDESAVTAVDKKDATCTEDGNVAYWHCALCGVNFDKNPITNADAKALDDVKLPALGHDYSVVKEPTCTKDGGTSCSRCGDISIVDPATGHDIKTYTYTATCADGTYGFVAYICQNINCDETSVTKIVNFQAPLHTWVATPYLAPTCNEDGHEGGHHCSVCNAVYELDGEEYGPTVLPKHHENDHGDTLVPGEGCKVIVRPEGAECLYCGTKDCTDEEHDVKYFTCVHDDCKLYENNARHNYIVIEQAATCVKPGHYVVICQNPDCKHEAVNATIDPKKDAHTAGNPMYDTSKNCETEGSVYFICVDCNTPFGHTTREHNYEVMPASTAPAIGKPGQTIEVCTYCSHNKTTDLEALEGIEFTYSITNANNDKAGFANGSFVNLTISYSAANIKVNQLYMNFKYDANVFKYLGVNYMGDKLPAHSETNADDAKGQIAIQLRANAEKNEYVDITGTDVTLAVIKFQINPQLYTSIDVADFSALVSAGFGLVGAEGIATSLDYKKINEETGKDFEVLTNGDALAADTVKILGLGDIDMDGVLEAEDLNDLLDLINHKSYSAVADINQDGKVNLIDYQLLNRVILLGSYETMCAAALGARR